MTSSDSSASRAGVQPPRGLRVLLVEDDPDMRDAVEALLVDRGHVVVAVGDGQTAWERCQAESFPLAILDWRLPRLDGLELCRRIRSLPDGDGRVILSMTARTQPSDLAEVLQAGANDYIPKPFDLALFDLRLTVAEWQVAQVAERERQRRRREALLRTARRFAAQADAEVLVRELLSEAVALLEVDDGVVTEWDEARRALVSVQRYRSSPGSAPLTFTVDEGASGRALRQRRTVIVNDYQAEVGEATPGGRARVQASVAAPLLHEGRMIGSLVVLSYRVGKSFGPDDAELLELLASLAAAALVGLERARLEGALLAARTAQHELSNQLALTVGHAELLALNPALPPRLREAAEEALRGAEQAAATLQRLQRVTRLEKIDWGPPTQPTIDLGRSTE